jgi:hypothetical protein
MTIFDLIFILSLFGTILSLAWAVRLAFQHHLKRSRRILARVFVCAAAYFTVVIGVSLFSPRRVMKSGDQQCFDDVCVSVDGFTRVTQGTVAKYELRIRLSSRARGAAQRENNLVVYLTDRQKRRYDPVANSTYTAFNILLQPQESILAVREFLVPCDTNDVSVVITHEGGFPIGWFIIDYDAWFRKPPLSPSFHSRSLVSDIRRWPSFMARACS